MPPPDRLADILRIYQDTLARPHGERSAYLDFVCGIDGELRGEVDALLAEPSNGPRSLLNTPPWKIPSLSRPGPAAPARGAHRLADRSGRGGRCRVARRRCRIHTRGQADGLRLDPGRGRAGLHRASWRRQAVVHAASEAREAIPLRHTEGARVLAISPDGQMVGFWSNGAIKTVPLSGGAAAERPKPPSAEVPSGLVWDTRGNLLADYQGGIYAFPPDGTVEKVTTAGEGEWNHSRPALLPGGRVLLYTVRRREWTWGDETVVAETLATGERKVLVRNATDARFVVATRHLLFMRYSDIRGAGQFAVAPTGTLAWVSGPVPQYSVKRLLTVDRHGQVAAVAAPELSYTLIVRLSPDGTQLAVSVRDLKEVKLATVDLSRLAPLNPLTRDVEALWPVWSPDGLTLFYRWLRDGRPALVAQLRDATYADVVSQTWATPACTTPDRRLLAVMPSEGGKNHVVAVSADSGRVEPLLETGYNEESPALSPDGRWLLYASDQTGRFEVYVRPYPGPGPSKPVSSSGGKSAAWRSDGREIFFVAPSDERTARRMMVANFAAGSRAKVGTAAELFRYSERDVNLDCSPVRCYDVAPDGQRFYATGRSSAVSTDLVAASPPPVTHIRLIENWFEELKVKVPVKW